MCTHVERVCVHECTAHGDQERVSDPVELKLHRVLGYLIWVLGIKSWSSGSAERVSCPANSPATCRTFCPRSPLGLTALTWWEGHSHGRLTVQGSEQCFHGSFLPGAPRLGQVQLLSLSKMLPPLFCSHESWFLRNIVGKKEISCTSNPSRSATENWEGPFFNSVAYFPLESPYPPKSAMFFLFLFFVERPVPCQLRGWQIPSPFWG